MYTCHYTVDMSFLGPRHTHIIMSSLAESARDLLLFFTRQKKQIPLFARNDTFICSTNLQRRTLVKTLPPDVKSFQVFLGASDDEWQGFRRR